MDFEGSNIFSVTVRKGVKVHFEMDDATIGALNLTEEEAVYLFWSLLPLVSRKVKERQIKKALTAAKKLWQDVYACNGSEDEDERAFRKMTGSDYGEDYGFH